MPRRGGLEVTQKKGISAENRDGEAAARLHVPARELFWMPPEEPFTKSFNTNQRSADGSSATASVQSGPRGQATPVEDIDVAGASEDDHDRFAMISLFDLNAEKTKERGNDEFKKGSSKGYEIAKRFYSLSLSFDPMQHAVYSNRSFANLKLGLPHFAAADAERCVAICPHFVKGHIRLADAYLAMGSIKEAVSCLRDAIQGPCLGNEEDVQFLKKKMQECMSPDSAKRVMVMKHAMGFDDPSLIHEPIFGFAPYGKLEKNWTKDKTVRSNPKYFSDMVSGQPVEVRDTEFGRAVFATSDIKAGQVAFEEPPIMTVTYDAKRCSFCASPITKAVKCPSCSCERYCSTSCRSAAKASYHEELCKRGEHVQALFDSMQSNSDLTETCQAFYAIKLIAAVLQQSNARGVSRSECCKELDMLCAWRDHDPDRLQGYACSYSSLRDQFRHASRVMGVQDDPYFDFEWFDRVGQSVSCNMIGITGMAVVLMNLGSMVNHSCSPNCQVSLAEGRYQLKALKDIKKGSEICYAYMDVRLPVEMRHMEISRTFMFDCNCQGRTSTGKP